MSVSAADLTGGRRLTSSSKFFQSARDFVGSERTPGDTPTRAVRTLRMSIPGFKDERRKSVRPRTPAALNNTSASAIWHMTKALKGLRALPAIVRDRERRVSLMALLLARNAGISPKISPVKTEVETAKRRTRQSTWMSSIRGIRSGQKRMKGRVPTSANNKPSRPPQIPSAPLSVKHSRSNRTPGAPSASRSANSC